MIVVVALVVVVETIISDEKKIGFLLSQLVRLRDFW